MGRADQLDVQYIKVETSGSECSDLVGGHNSWRGAVNFLLKKKKKNFLNMFLLPQFTVHIKFELFQCNYGNKQTNHIP